MMSVDEVKVVWMTIANFFLHNQHCDYMMPVGKDTVVLVTVDKCWCNRKEFTTLVSSSAEC